MSARFVYMMWAHLSASHKYPAHLLTQMTFRNVQRSVRILVPYSLYSALYHVHYIGNRERVYRERFRTQLQFLTAFYGFMRPGEYTSPTQTFSPTRGLAFADVTFFARHFSIFLKRSKSDSLGVGATIIISRINNSLCPYASMLLYPVCELRGSRGSYSSPSGDMSSPGMVCEILGEL